MPLMVVGLSLLFFILSLMGNVTYGAGVSCLPSPLQESSADHVYRYYFIPLRKPISLPTSLGLSVLWGPWLKTYLYSPSFEYTQRNKVLDRLQRSYDLVWYSYLWELAKHLAVQFVTFRISGRRKFMTGRTCNIAQHIKDNKSRF